MLFCLIDRETLVYLVFMDHEDLLDLPENHLL